MAELLSADRLSEGREFEREWTALREYVSRWSDKEQLQQSSCSYGQSRGLLTATCSRLLNRGGLKILSLRRRATERRQ